MDTTVQSNKKIKIAVIYSFESQILDEFNKECYLKLFCGDSHISEDFFKKIDYFDNEGNENISYLNKYFNEMTGIYWIYKNYNKIGNPDFIGTAHYRRFLNFNCDNLDLKNIICHFEKQPYSIFYTYSLYHIKDDLLLFNREFSRKYQEYAVDLNDYMNQNVQCIRNMFIMPRDMFLEYGCFIEKCINILIKIQPSLNLDSRDRYQIRGMGFILERMTGFWIFHKLRAKECNVIDSNIISFDINSPYQRK